MIHEARLTPRLPDSATLGRMIWLLDRMLAQGERTSIHYERLAPFSRGTYFRTRNACIAHGLVTPLGSGRMLRPEPARIAAFLGQVVPRIAALIKD